MLDRPLTGHGLGIVMAGNPGHRSRRGFPVLLFTDPETNLRRPRAESRASDDARARDPTGGAGRAGADGHRAWLPAAVVD